MTKRDDERDKMMEGLHKDLQNGVRNLINSEDWIRWLDAAAKFYTYSFNNTLLIMLQRPDATYVNSYKRWASLGRQVRKGETGIRIFAPMGRKVDDGTGTETYRVFGFRAVPVFDISQTDGEPLPEQPAPVLLEGEAPAGLYAALEGILADRGYTLERGQCPGGANGVTTPATKTVRVRDDVSDAQAVKTLAHEVAHVLLHTDDTDLTRDAMAHRSIAEVEAESVAYLIAKMHGLPTESYSLPYVAAWGGKDGETAIRTTADRVLKTARLVTAQTLAETGEPATLAEAV